MSTLSVPKQPRGKGSKEKILHAATALFAARGFDGVSLRDISDKSKVNVGLIHYFFGSKENLLKEVFLQVGDKLASRRLELLDSACANTSESPLTVEKIVELFLRPAFEIAGQGPQGRAFLKLQARLQLEQNAVSRDLRAKLYDESSRRFFQALQLVIPGVSRSTLYWRYIFVLGAYQYTLADTGRLEVVSGGTCSSADLPRAMAEVVAFISAGLRAPQVAAT